MKKIKSFEDFFRELRIIGSNNGCTTRTKIVKDKKKTYNRQQVKKDSQDPSFLFVVKRFLLSSLLVEAMILFFVFLDRLLNLFHGHSSISRMYFCML